jgi:hypothetical protein
MRNTDAANGATGTGYLDRSADGLLGADAFEDGVNSVAAGKRSYALDRFMRPCA